MNLEPFKSLPSLEQRPANEFTHDFKGFGTHKSRCLVQIWRGENCCAVLFTDLNIGTSVTNAAEQIIEEVYSQHLKQHYPRERCLFIETYDKTEGLDIIVPKWDGERVYDVDWKHLGKII